MYRCGTAFHSPLSLSLSALKMCLVPYPAYNYQSNFSKVKETSVVKSEIVRRSCPGTDDSSNLSASPPSSDHALLNKIRVDWSSYVCLSSSFCSHSDFITPRGFPCKKQCFKHITDLAGVSAEPQSPPFTTKFFRTKISELLPGLFFFRRTTVLATVVTNII